MPSHIQGGAEPLPTIGNSSREKLEARLYIFKSVGFSKITLCVFDTRRLKISRPCRDIFGRRLSRTLSVIFEKPTCLKIYNRRFSLSLDEFPIMGGHPNGAKRRYRQYCYKFWYPSTRDDLSDSTDIVLPVHSLEIRWWVLENMERTLWKSGISIIDFTGKNADSRNMGTSSNREATGVRKSRSQQLESETQNPKPLGFLAKLEN